MVPERAMVSDRWRSQFHALETVLRILITPVAKKTLLQKLQWRATVRKPAQISPSGRFQTATDAYGRENISIHRCSGNFWTKTEFFQMSPPFHINWTLVQVRPDESKPVQASRGSTNTFFHPSPPAGDRSRTATD